MKLLIKLGIILAMMLSSLFGNAQSKADEVYDLFSGENGVVSFSFSKSVLKPFEIFIDDETKQVIYKMKKVRFLSYNEEKGDLYASKVYGRILDELDGAGYFEIDPDEIDCDNCNIEMDDDDDIRLIGHGKRKTMDEFHIVLNDENDFCLMFSFYGDISVEDLKQCQKFTGSTKGIITL